MNHLLALITAVQDSTQSQWRDIACNFLALVRHRFRTHSLLPFRQGNEGLGNRT